jgi:hypothetical protein
LPRRERRDPEKVRKKRRKRRPARPSHGSAPERRKQSKVRGNWQICILREILILIRGRTDKQERLVINLKSELAGPQMYCPFWKMLFRYPSLQIEIPRPTNLLLVGLVGKEEWV